jgi:hypothetical protein
MLRVYAQCADAHCPPLTRPHNLHYIECPPRKAALRACRSAGCLISSELWSVRVPRDSFEVAYGAPHGEREGSLLTLQPSTVLAASRAGKWPKTATLDAAALDAGRAWPTALAVSG